MKKLITTITIAAAFLFTNPVAHAQMTEATLPDTLIVLSQKDEMSDKTYYLLSKKIICFNQEATKGFSLSAFIEPDLTVRDIKTVMVGIGSCVEKNEMIIMFEDDSKLTFKSWNGFNCKGDAWFTITKKDVDILSTKKIKKVRLTNGRTYESYTADLEEKYSDYYIRLFRMLKNKQVFQFEKK